MESRELFGIIGSLERVSEHMKWWNAEFVSKGLDAVMSRYQTEENALPERLSEMFHFDRRGYIVGFKLQEAIIPLLDNVDASAVEEGRVDTIVNTGGVMTGYFCNENREKQWELWFQAHIH
ncbi:hypothetical protein COU75_04325 [Candidatus Peregrinibacteria bacterium CG10_big_fil_rev_8_21_14_0_10_42_8]|nr:MAG: hypothetical protein COU75_04325 [Candidatus Peregrinibacteria bacterium CG10_big_fil_rev_8_21_14_0_10_42_8]